MNAAASRDRFWFAMIGIMSAAAIAAVAFVLTGPRLASGLDVSALPAVNTHGMPLPPCFSLAR